MLTRTAQLEVKIRNEQRRKRRLLASGDIRRMIRMEAVRLPSLLEEVEAHNDLIEKLSLAAIEARMLADVIESPRPGFRRSYHFEASLEDLAIGRIRISNSYVT